MSASPEAADVEDVDVLIIGAGLSGIGAACMLSRRAPQERYVVLEARPRIGGTWDPFRYPGIRSDSDMYTLGYIFKPWKDGKALADGPAIKRYIEEAAREHGVDQHIRFEHKVVHAEWSSAQARWVITAELPDGSTRRFSCRFLQCCSGYYNYEQGYQPDFAGAQDYQGQLIHPQHWPEDLDYAGKRVVVIGSGATAVTLVPAMAEQAAHVTMLQRSPSYILSLPNTDPIARGLARVLPERWAYSLTRWKNVLLSMLLFNLSRRRPRFMRKLLRKGVVAALGENYPVDVHFNPRYDPWDQRLCMIPNGDLFRALRAGRAEIVTDSIERFTTGGIRLQSGQELPADIVVSATGLDLKILGGVTLVVDGEERAPRDVFVYRGMMVQDVPNFAFTVGYTNASWTLKADLTAAFVCRLLNHMRKQGYRQATPRLHDTAMSEEPIIDFSSGYVTRALDRLPRQGSKAPWKLYQNYIRDRLLLGRGRLEDGAMEFR